MKILIYGLHFKPDLIGIGKYTGEMADWLYSKGHEIRIITAPHFYPEWKAEKGNWYYKKQKSPFKVWRCPTYVPRKPNSIKRLIHLLSFAISSIPISLLNIKWKPNYIISIEPPFFTSPFTLFYSRLTKAKSILHIQDLEIDAALSLQMLKNGALLRFIKKIEKIILGKFDVVSTISNGMKNELIKKGIDDNSIRVVPNWADLDEIRPGIDSDFLRKQLKIDKNKRIILYSGNMGEKQNLGSVIDVAKTFQKEDVLFLMVGDGASKARLIQKVKNENLKNIKFLPLQPNNDFPALLTLADIHLVTQYENIADYVMPSKLTNILSAGGVSIIAAKNGTELSNLVKNYNIGYLVKPNSIHEIINAVNELLNNDYLIKTIGTNARKYAEEHLSKDKILNEFMNSLI